MMENNNNNTEETPQETSQETSQVHIDGEDINDILEQMGVTLSPVEADEIPVSQGVNTSVTATESSEREVLGDTMLETFLNTSSNTSESEEIKEEVKEEPSLIEEKFKPVLLKEEMSRFKGSIWFKKIQEQEIILAGLGGIGSYVAFLLSRLHPESIVLYDDDIVDASNLSGQMYGENDICDFKVSASVKCMENYSRYHSIFPFKKKYDENCGCSDIVICGFDNMKARKAAFLNWTNYVYSLDADRRKDCLFIDGRLAAEEFQIYAVTGDDSYHINLYGEKYLFTDEEAEQTVCSLKQTSFTANMIASVMVNIFVNFIANQCDILIPRPVPFYTYYDASLMFLNTYDL